MLELAIHPGPLRRLEANIRFQTPQALGELSCANRSNNRRDEKGGESLAYGAAN
jgi:hypothetical protein